MQDPEHVSTASGIIEESAGGGQETKEERAEATVAAQNNGSNASSQVATPVGQETQPSQGALSPDGSLLTPRAPTVNELVTGDDDQQGSSDYFSSQPISNNTSSTIRHSYTPMGEPPAGHAHHAHHTHHAHHAHHAHHEHHVDLKEGTPGEGPGMGSLQFVPHPGHSSTAHDSAVAQGSGLLWKRTAPKRSMSDLVAPNASRIDRTPRLNPLQSSAAGDYYPYSAEPLDDQFSADADSVVEKVIERISRTVGNSPAQTPGLFSPKQQFARRTWESSDDGSPYPSPYLNPTQPQIPPKETHVAERQIDLQSGRKMVNQYEIMEELGRGVHGKVKLARNMETGGIVAIKIVQRFSKRKRLGKAWQSQEETVKREIAILKKIHHPNVVKMIEVIDDPELTKIYLVLEFCELREINWRFRGSDEIILLENKRIESESRGLTSVRDIAHNEKRADRYLRAAAKRRDEARQQQRRRPLAPRRSESEYWSLEFASDDTEDEEQHVNTSTSAPLSRPMSTASSLAPEDSQSVSGGGPDAMPDEHDIGPHDIINIDPLDTVSLPRSHDQPHDQPGFGDAQHLQPAMPIPQRLLLQHQLQEDQLGELSASLWSRLSESMPSMGSEAKESSRGRQSSVAESTLSHLSEIVERTFPEDLRFVPTMTLQECRHAFRDAVLGLEYLHYQGVVHRDIKPANLLRTADGRVKISDFGVSYLGHPKREDGEDSAEVSEAESVDAEEETELAKTVGTPAFYAPELCDLEYLADVVDGKKVTNMIDVWALGVTLYCMLFARTPFAGETENEYVLMRKITHHKIFISRRRLKAVDSRPSSRSSSVGPLFRQKMDKRLPHQLVYDDIDDELFDLLSRLLTKDPRDRIKLAEVKTHPWVLRDIPNPALWLEQTNPHRQYQGKKIETSHQDVADAILPLKIVERASSAVKKTFTNAMAVLSGRGRNRSKSTAHSADGGPAPSSSGSSLASEPALAAVSHREARRQSLKPGDPSAAATVRFQDHLHLHHHEHPLSQSVTASPDAIKEQDNPLERVLTTQSAYERPPMPDRGNPNMVSTRTIRPSDFAKEKKPRAASPRSQHPLTASNLQTFLDPLGGSNLGAIFGAGRSLVRSMRSRDRSSRSKGGSPAESPIATSRSQSQARSGSLDHHADASLALDKTQAEGHVNPPTAVRGRSPAGIESALLPHDERPPADVLLSTLDNDHKAPDPAPAPADPLSLSLSVVEASGHHNIAASDEGTVRDLSSQVSAAFGANADLTKVPGSSSSTQTNMYTSSEDRDHSVMSQTTSLPSMASTASSTRPPSDLQAVYSTKGSQGSDETTRERHSPSRRIPISTGRTYLELTTPKAQSPEEDEGYAGDRDRGKGDSGNDEDDDNDDDDDDDGDDSDGGFLMMNRSKARRFSRSLTKPPKTA